MRGSTSPGSGRVGHTQQQEQGNVPRAEPGGMLYPRSCMVVTQSRAPAPRVPLAKVSLEQGAGGSCPVLPSLHPFPSFLQLPAFLWLRAVSFSKPELSPTMTRTRERTCAVSKVPSLTAAASSALSPSGFPLYVVHCQARAGPRENPRRLVNHTSV